MGVKEAVPAGTRLVRTEDGRDVAVCEWGLPDGRPLFYLHGTLGGRLLRHVNGEYERNALRVVTYDRPGFGLSTRQPGRTVADGAGDIIAIADALGLSTFGVVGVSGGGPYALAVAALCPDRVTRCATIVSGAPLGAEGLDFFAGMDEQSQQQLRAMIEGGEAYLLEDFEAVPAWLDEFAAESTEPDSQADHAMAVTAFRDALSAGPHGYVDDCLAELQPYGFDLSDVVAPTRLMFAREDGSIPATHATWLMHRIPHAQLQWVDGGHFGPRVEAEEGLMAWVAGAP